MQVLKRVKSYGIIQKDTLFALYTLRLYRCWNIRKQRVSLVLDEWCIFYTRLAKPRRYRNFNPRNDHNYIALSLSQSTRPQFAASKKFTTKPHLGNAVLLTSQKSLVVIKNIPFHENIISLVYCELGELIIWSSINIIIYLDLLFSIPILCRIFYVQRKKPKTRTVIPQS